MTKANKYSFQPVTKPLDPDSDKSPFAHVTISPSPEVDEPVENPWTMKGSEAQGDGETSRAIDLEEDRLSNIYTGMELDEQNRKSTKKFFTDQGPTMFQEFKRRSYHGQVNFAYQHDDDESFDGNSVTQLGGHSSDDDSLSLGQEEEELYQPETSPKSTGIPNGKPAHNGNIANGGKDFTVNFEAIKPQAKPPPIPLHRSSTKKPKERPKWDRFMTTSKDNVSNQDIEFWDRIFVVTKIVVCGLLFLFTLMSAVIAKMCFIIITANIYPANGTLRDGAFVKDIYHNNSWNRMKTANHTLMYDITHTHPLWIWALIMMMGAPYLFSFLDGFWKTFFQLSSRYSPSCLTIFWVLLIEFLHSLGVNIMMLVIIPNFDPFSGVLLMWSVGILPGCLKVIYPRVKEKGDARDTSLSTKDKMKSYALKILVGVVSLVGALGQILALGLWCLHLYKSFEEHDTSTYVGYLICLIIAPLLTSIHWWENFVHQGKKDSIGLPLLARDIRRCRTKLKMYSSLWKLLLSIILPTIIFTIFCDQTGKTCIDTLYFVSKSSNISTGLLTEYFTSDESFGKCNDYLPIIIASIGIICSGLLFKLCKVACKILTQIFDMSLPLALSLPATLGIIFGMYTRSITTEGTGCAIPFPVLVDRSGKDYLSKLTDEPLLWLPWAAGAVAFLSFTIVTNHVWLPGKQRLQRTDKLFVQPLYCGIFSEQSIMLNRRRIEHAKHLDTKGKKSTFQLPLPDEVEQDLSGRSLYRTDNTPMIYMCATMWHENENEMTQLLKSIFRMDEDQCTRKNAQFLLNSRDPDYYEFEAHIFFDDAFTAHKEDEYEFTVNKYVKELMKTVVFSASAIHGASFKLDKPQKVATPYGGRLVWSLPGGNQLIAHLKDKQVIRHRKRWSQVMYMYYFLAYELFRTGTKKGPKRLQKQADNTFLLALDGDVDFHPSSVRLLVDRMRKNPEVGAACGRIHPIGDGAMVWYQKFEYAVSHWLQKAAEDKLGCVLCSPGCFSMFRGSSLMDDNVMNRYTTPPTEPRHYVQYDQGEDRWLCTLLLQQGHRVEYCAASDALTYAPEGFFEFFNQRRRWTPSTMANILDLLSDWKSVTKKNPDISLLYVMYQGLLMVSSILTPGTIFLMILGAITMAYPAVDLWVSLLINAVPIGLMVMFCFCAKSETQLNYAAILSTGYSLVMMIVIVGLLQQAVNYGFCSVTTIFLSFVAGVFVTAAFIHPQEFWCIIHGFLYFLAIPSMSMVLMIYSLGNLHVVSWGTRENKTAAEVKEEKLMSGLSGILKIVTMCCPGNAARQEDARLQAILNRLENIEENISNFSMPRSNASTSHSLLPRSGTPIMLGEDASAKRFSQIAHTLEGGGTTANPAFQEEQQRPRDLLVDPYWMEDEDMVRLQQAKIPSDEIIFWNELMEEYLKPIVEPPEEKERIQGELIELRNKVCLIFLLINSLFIIIVFSLQQVVASDSKLSITICETAEDDPGQRIEPISMAFTLVFGVLLLFQFICMLMHRIATLLHICAATEVFKKKRKMVLPDRSPEEQERTEISYDQAMLFVRDLQKNQDEDSISMVSESSFASEVDDDEESVKKRQEMKLKWKKLARQRQKISHATLGTNFRKNFEKVQSFVAQGEDEDSLKEDDPEKEGEDLRKKAHLRRLTQKSVHFLKVIKRDSELQKSIVKKKIKVQGKFRDAINKVKISNLQEKMRSNGGNIGGRKTSSDLFSKVVMAAKGKRDTEHMLDAVDNADEDDMVEVAVGHEGDEPFYTSVDELRPKKDFTVQAEHHRSSVSDDDNDGDGDDDSINEHESKKQDTADGQDDPDYDDTATFRLSVPKVEDDKWPEEDDYAVGDFADVKL